MSNLDNIVNKILEDSALKSEELIKAARKEEERLISSKTSEARLIEKQILDKAARESITAKERILSGAQLKVRNEKLEAKQSIINKVFQKAIDELNNMKREDLENYIIERIASMNITGEEKLILSKGYFDSLEEEKNAKSSQSNLVELVKEKLSLNKEENALIKRINDALKARGKKGSISLSGEIGNFKGGFILEKDGIQINNTFEALVNSLRDELQYDIAKKLFD